MVVNFDKLRDVFLSAVNQSAEGAPFGPMNATDWPFSIDKVMPSTAVVSLDVQRIPSRFFKTKFFTS